VCEEISRIPRVERAETKRARSVGCPHGTGRGDATSTNLVQREVPSLDGREEASLTSCKESPVLGRALMLSSELPRRLVLGMGGRCLVEVSFLLTTPRLWRKAEKVPRPAMHGRAASLSQVQKHGLAVEGPQQKACESFMIDSMMAC